MEGLFSQGVGGQDTEAVERQPESDFCVHPILLGSWVVSRVYVCTKSAESQDSDNDTFVILASDDDKFFLWYSVDIFFLFSFFHPDLQHFEFFYVFLFIMADSLY